MTFRNSEMAELETSDTRRATQNEMDRLRTENTRIWNTVKQLREEMRELELENANLKTGVTLLRAQITRQSAQLQKYVSLDNHPEAGPA